MKTIFLSHDFDVRAIKGESGGWKAKVKIGGIWYTSKIEFVEKSDAESHATETILESLNIGYVPSF